VNDLAQRRVGINERTVLSHQIGDVQTDERFFDRRTAQMCSSCVAQEQANQRKPKSGAEASPKEWHLIAKRHHDAEHDEEDANALSGVARDVRRALEVSGSPPNDRTKDSTTIEGKSWDQIEEANQDVHRTEPREQCGDRSKPRDNGLRSSSSIIAPKTTTNVDEKGREDRHPNAKRDAHERTDDRDEELRAWRWWF